MDTKHNFTGIIIPIVIAVILLTVLPILTNMSTDCPPCAECPPCEVEESITYEYVLPVTADYEEIEMGDVIYLTIVFGWKTPTSEKIINEKPYYVSPYAKFINYRLYTPQMSREMLKPLSEEMGQEYYQLFWHDFVGNTLTIQAPLNPINYECLGMFYATSEEGGNTTLSFTNEFGYKVDGATSSSIENGIIFDLTKYEVAFSDILQGITYSFRRTTDDFYYLPKLGAQDLFVTYND